MIILFSLVSFQIWNKFEPGCSLKQYKIEKYQKFKLQLSWSQCGLRRNLFPNTHAKFI